MYKTITSPFVLMALLSSNVSAIEYPEKAGHCPFDAGHLISNVKDTLNSHRLTGRWMNVFDKKTLNENHKCYGVKLMHTFGFDEETQQVHNEESMKDVAKLFEYIKSSNVGESFDPLDVEPEEEQDDNINTFGYPQHDYNKEDNLLAFGYHIYNGLQLNFNAPNDKSIAYLQHRDVQLVEHDEKDIHEHDHTGQKEEFFNEHVFDSQFKRYAQVLDTDYDNYMVLYQCRETAQYFSTETGHRIPNYEAWADATSSSINFSAWPQTSYVFNNKVEVKPLHHENVKILWRPQNYREQYYEPESQEESGFTFEELEAMKNSMPTNYRYLDQDGHLKMNEEIEKLKLMIAQKHPHIDFDEYALLDHVNGRCDYDPYDRYDAVYHDEGESFGHMYSESIEQHGDPVYNETPIEEPVDEEEDQENIEYPDTGYDDNEMYNPEDSLYEENRYDTGYIDEELNNEDTNVYDGAEPDLEYNGDEDYQTDFESEQEL